MQKLSGILLVLLSSSAFGIMPIFAHLAYDSGMDPVTLLWIRFSLTAIVFWGILTIQRIPSPQPRHCLLLLAIGGISFVAQSLCYFLALTLIPSSLVALLLYLYPSIITAFSIVFLRETVTFTKLGTLALATIGVALTVGIDSAQSGWGLVLGLSTAILYAVYILLVSQILARESSPLACLTWVMTGAALMYSLLVAFRERSFPTQATGWGALLVIAIVCTALAALTLFEGIQRIGTTTAATLSTWEPVVTVVTAALFLGDRLTPLGWVGGTLILLAVFLTGRSQLSDPG